MRRGSAALLPLTLAAFMIPLPAEADGPAVDFPSAVSLSDVVLHGRLVGSVNLVGYEVMLFSADRAWRGCCATKSSSPRDNTPTSTWAVPTSSAPQRANSRGSPIPEGGSPCETQRMRT